MEKGMSLINALSDHKSIRKYTSAGVGRDDTEMKI